MTDGGAPEVMTAELAAAEARRLLTEVARVGEIRAVREAGTTSAGPPDFAAAFERLLGGETRRLQVHYRHEGTDWIDTYLATPTGFRIVRVRAPEAGRIAGSGD